jgi:hypothetical protein
VVRLDPALVRAIASGFTNATLGQIETTDDSGADLPACEIFWNVLNGTLSANERGRTFTADHAAASTSSTSGLARNLAAWTGNDPEVDSLLPQCGQEWIGREMTG